MGTRDAKGGVAIMLEGRGLELSPSLVISIAAYTVLTVLVLQHPGFTNHAVAVVGDVFLGLTLSGLFNALTFFALAFMYGFKRLVPHSKIYLVGMFFALVLGVAAKHFAADGGNLSLALVVLGDALTGASLACIGVEEIRVFTEKSSRSGAANLIAAMFLAALLTLPSGVLSREGLTLYRGALVVICFSALRFARGGARHGANAAVSPKYGASSKVQVPKKLMATILIQGLSAGIVQGMFTFGDRGGFFFSEGAAYACAGVVSIVFFFVLRRDFNHLLYVVAFPIMALGHLGLSLAGVTLGVVLVHETGYRFMMFLSWMLAAWVIKHKELSPNWVWPCIMCAFVAGRFLGVIFGSLGDSLFGIQEATAGQMIMVFVILFSALVLFGSANLSDGWGMTTAASEGEMGDGAKLSQALSLMAKEHGLTPREIEVATLLARGRDQSFIAGGLCISVDTVKTHRRSIYRKLNIHSHQELLALVERTKDDVDSDVLA